MIRPKRLLVICVDDSGYKASLDRRKIYEAIPDAAATKRGMLRILDDSGASYLYPEERFVVIALPPAVRRAVMASA